MGKHAGIRGRPHIKQFCKVFVCNNELEQKVYQSDGVMRKRQINNDIFMSKRNILEPDY